MRVLTFPNETIGTVEVADAFPLTGMPREYCEASGTIEVDSAFVRVVVTEGCADLSFLADVGHLEGLILLPTVRAAHDLAFLDNQPNLKHISFQGVEGVGIDEEAFRALGKLNALVYLEMCNAGITVDKIRAMSGLPLTLLLMTGDRESATAFDDGCAEVLPEALPSLRHLTIYNGRLTDDSFRWLSTLTSLVSLSLIGSPGIEGRGLRHLSGLRELTMLQIRDASLSSTALLELPLLPDLESLTLSGNPINAEILDHLERLPSLTTLRATNTGLTPDELKAFHKRLADRPSKNWKMVDGVAYPASWEV